MSSQQHPYAVNDPEAALKYAIRHIDADRVEIVEEGSAPSCRHGITRASAT